MSEPPSGGYFILARVENKGLLNEIVNHYLEKSVTFSVSKNPHLLVTKAAKEYPMEADSGETSVEKTLADEDLGSGGTSVLDQESVQEQEKQQTDRIEDQETASASTSTAEPVALQQFTTSGRRKRKANDDVKESKKKNLEPQASKLTATPALYRTLGPVENQEEGLNAADLLIEDEEPQATEFPTTSMNPYYKSAVVPNCTSIDGPRIVRIVRSSDLEPKNNDVKTEGAVSPKPQEEIICNLRITEAVDWIAKADCDLALLMIKEGYLPSSKMCPRCNNRIHPYFQNFKLEWRCMYIHCKGVTMSLFANTWFSYLNLPLKQIMKIIILWAQSRPADDIRTQLAIPIKTVWLVENRIRETCIRVVNSYEPLGGDAVEVQLGLRMIGTKKFNHVSGRATKTNKQVLVGVEPRSGRCFLHVVTGKKPIYAALDRWIRSGSLVNGCMYESAVVSEEFVGKLDLWNVDGRPFVLDAFTQLAPSDLGDVIGETLPGYLAEMVVRLNEKENTLKKLMGWLHYWKQPQPGPKGQTMPLDLLNYCPEPVREDMARLGLDGEGQRMGDGGEMERSLFGDKDSVKTEPDI